MTGGPTSPARALGRGDTRPAFPAPLWQSWRNRGPLSPLPPSGMVGSFSTTRRNRVHAAPGRAAHGKRNLFEERPSWSRHARPGKTRKQPRFSLLRDSPRCPARCPEKMPGPAPACAAPVGSCAARAWIARRTMQRNLLRARPPGCALPIPTGKTRRRCLLSGASLHGRSCNAPFHPARTGATWGFRPRSGPGVHEIGGKSGQNHNIATRIVTLYPLCFLDSS